MGIKEQEMSGEIWQHLPGEILMKVVQKHLQLRPLCRFRCVCSAWNLIQSVPNPAVFRDLYACCDINCRLTLLDGHKQRFYVLDSVPYKLDTLGTMVSCLNGWIIFVTALCRIRFAVCNMLSGHWPRIPRLPSAGRRGAFIFAGMIKISGHPGSIDFSDYILVAAMTTMVALPLPETLHKDLVLRVFTGGKWRSRGVVEFPAGHAFMCHASVAAGSNGVLRGSVYYFLIISLDKSSVRLCSLDVLQDQRCKVLCDVNPSCVIEWAFQGIKVPKLAVCSGKILMFYVLRVGEVRDFTCTMHVQMLDEEKMCWRYLSSFPHTLVTRSFWPRRMSCGRDELIAFEGLYAMPGDPLSYVYNVSTNSWTTIKMTREYNVNMLPISYA